MIFVTCYYLNWVKGLKKNTAIKDIPQKHQTGFELKTASLRVIALGPLTLVTMIIYGEKFFVIIYLRQKKVHKKVNNKCQSTKYIDPTI